ncbi:MAG: carbohydrate ABC transporter permease [Anaerolineae bacterium]|nr:carbohydrate ABC transporter permease [Anaerolineae bacterium]
MASHGISSVRRGGLGQRAQTVVVRTICYILLLVIGASMLIPFLWMISTSLKNLAEAQIYPPRWIPKDLLWSNYREVMVQIPFPTFIVNSFKISVLGVIGQTLTCSMAAYALARLRFKGRGFLFVLLLSTLMIPYQVTMIPQFLIFKSLGWVNKHMALIAPFWLGGAFGTFLIRQFFLSLPADLADAAKVDGCNPFHTYWRIYMPLTKPAVTTLAVFTFMGRWNDLLGPLIYLNRPLKMTVTAGLSYFQGQYYADMPLLMAGSVVSIIPTLVLFAVAQKYFVQGVVLTGIKG